MAKKEEQKNEFNVKAQNGLKMHHMFLFVVAASIIADSDGVLKSNGAVYTSTQGGSRLSIHTLQCEEGGRVLIVDVRIQYTGFPCCSASSSSCYDWPSPGLFSLYRASCDNSSSCIVSVLDETRACGSASYSPAYVTLLYTCSKASTVIPVDSPGSSSGMAVSAHFSSADVRNNNTFACVVEASDCTVLNSSLELFITNTRRDSSTFFFTEATQRLGAFTLQNTEASSLTPYKVDLHVVAGSRVLAAYVVATAAKNLTMTCGLSKSSPFYQQCALPIVSATPRRMLGQVMSARYFSSQQVSATGTWLCSVQAADCSSNATVSVFLYVYNTPGSPVSTLNMNDVTLGKVGTDSTLLRVAVPFNVTLTLVGGSSSYVAVDVNASVPVSLTCGPPSEPGVTDFCSACQSSPCQGLASCVPSPGSFQCLCPAGFNSSSDGLACLDINECTRSPPPCDVTAHCNNTVGSFHCFCDAGFSLTVNSTGCRDLNECTTTPPPCDDTAHCNNTEGSFHCYCDPGYNLTVNGKGCTGPDAVVTVEVWSLELKIAIGVVCAVVFLAIVIVVPCCCWRRQRSTRPPGNKTLLPTTAPKASASNGRNNSTDAYAVISPDHRSKAHETTTPTAAVPLAAVSPAPAPHADSADSQPDTEYDRLGQKRKPADVESGGVYGHLTANIDVNSKNTDVNSKNTEMNSKENTEITTSL